MEDLHGMLPGLAYAVCRIFFRRIHLSGSPYVGPSCIWAANHASGIVDPIVMFGLCPVKLRPISKHTLFDHPVMRPLLLAARAIPIQRIQDMKREVEGQRQELEKGTPDKEWRGSANTEAFRTVSDAILAGDCILIFPEGISHDEPRIHKFKTGIARMALQAITHAPDPQTRVFIQPVAIDYAEKDEFRSDLNVHFCEPIVVTTNEMEVDDIMSGLRRSLEDGLAQFETWDDKRNWQFIFEMAYGRDPHSAREFRAFVESQRPRFGADPVFLARVRTMRRMLMALSIEPFQLIWGETHERKRSFYAILLKHVWFHVFVSRPLQSLSAFLWYVPYRMCGVLAESSTKDRDVVATMKIGHGVWLFPLWGLLLAGTLFLCLRALAPGLVDSTGNVLGFAVSAIFGPFLLVAGLWLSERRDFFPGYWRLARLRLFFPRAWREVMAEWREMSQGVIDRIHAPNDEAGEVRRVVGLD
jgi:1-acyl-sn-glycerol-3-phosphate acyltransferase